MIALRPPWVPCMTIHNMANTRIVNTGQLPLRTMYIKYTIIRNRPLLIHNPHHSAEPTPQIRKHHGTPPSCCEAELNKSRHIQRGIDCAKTQNCPKCKFPVNRDGESLCQRGLDGRRAGTDLCDTRCRLLLVHQVLWCPQARPTNRPKRAKKRQWKASLSLRPMRKSVSHLVVVVPSQ